MIGFPKLGASARRTFRRNDRLEDLAAEVFARFVGDLSREVEAGVVHREQHAVDRQVRVDAPLDEVDGVQQLREPLERVVLALERNQQRVGRREHVER